MSDNGSGFESMSSRVREAYEFGPFRLDATERVLARDGENVRLTPKEFETLLALVRNSGHLMTKGELLKEVWPDTFVEEATLAQNIFTLRKALGRGAQGDDAPQYIETVPRRGYRFVAGVRELKQEAADANGVEENGHRTIAAATEVETESQHATSQEAVAHAGRNGHKGHKGHDGHDAARSEVGDGASPSSAIDAAGVMKEPLTGTQEFDAEERGHPVRAAVLISLAVVLVFAGVVFLVFKFVVRPQTAQQPPRQSAFQSMEVTRLPVTGDVREAVISPDGKYVAYVADDRDRQGIFVRQVAANSGVQQLVAPAAATGYVGLVFSPDTAHLYYVAFRGDGSEPTLYQVPVLGGAPRKVLEGLRSPITFAPDGRRIAFLRGADTDERGADERRTLFVADADGANARGLVTHALPEIFGAPAWSPDGKSIACVLGSLNTYNFSDALLGVVSVNVEDGTETRLTPERWVGVSQLSWLPGGGGLLVSAAERELSPSQIWRLSLADGEVRRVTNDLNIYLGASVTADASALVTVQTDRAPNIWVAPQGDAARAEQITSGAGKLDGIYGVSWAPDGRVVYASVASGNWDIWVMDADGGNRRQLTVDARSNYGPSVSADGRHVVFVSNRAGGPFNVWRMEIDGSNPKQLTFGKGENFAHFTPDGQWVVYATVSFADKNLVWKVPFDGGQPVALTDKSSSWPFVSPDGKWVVCTYSDAPNTPRKLAVVPIEGGPPAKLFDVEPSFRANTVWLPDNRGIAFLDNRTGTTNVWLQPTNGGKPTQLTDFKANGVVSYDWSRDNRLAATRSVESTGIVLIRNFSEQQ